MSLHACSSVLWCKLHTGIRTLDLPSPPAKRWQKSHTISDLSNMALRHCAPPHQNHPEPEPEITLTTCHHTTHFWLLRLWAWLQACSKRKPFGWQDQKGPANQTRWKTPKPIWHPSRRLWHQRGTPPEGTKPADIQAGYVRGVLRWLTC